MPSNTVYIPTGVQLDPSKVQGAGMGVTAVCGALTTTNIDLTVADDMILTGLNLRSFGTTPGDYVTLKVLIGGTPILTPVDFWYLATNEESEFSLNFPMKVVTGLTLRAIVTTTALLITPRVAINYKLWKVLV